ncbi:RHS repeat-associated core domain-containing protein [Streptomyces sp. NPDC002677]|uniref:RHS repeat-associated core domain-containing protein n=1 Tax=Streptomyces sp. NPDC002677 TaxID=3154774 RepID=UPI0033205FF0
MTKGPTLDRLPHASAPAGDPKPDAPESAASAPGAATWGTPTAKAAGATAVNGAVAADPAPGRAVAAATTIYGATYVPETPFAVQPAHNVDGYMWVTVKNTSTANWAAHSVYLGYHLYKSDNSVYSFNGYGADITTTVKVGASVRVLAYVEPLPAGSFKLAWDVAVSSVGDDTKWFTAHGVPASATLSFTIPHTAPTAKLVYPLKNATVATLTPELEINLSADKTATVSSQLQVCQDEAVSTGCHDSGWQTVTMGDSFAAAAVWRVPAGYLKWNTTYYWRARVKDSVTAPWSEISSFTPVVTPAAGGAQYGVDAASLDPAGVSLFAGNYTRDETDLSLPVPSGEQPLAVERVYNSASTFSGAFGTGWSSLLDMAVQPTAEGWAKVTFKDGKQIQFGKNPDGTWAPSYGEGDSVKFEGTLGTTVTWLRFSDGSSAEFAGSTGKSPIAAYFSPDGSKLTFTSTAGHITEISQTPSQRSLHLTWTGNHITSVSAGSDATGTDRYYTWNYTYSGDQLKKVCDAEPTPRCTSYTYGATDSAHTVARLTQVDKPKTGNTTKLTYQGDYLYTLSTPSDLVSGGWDTWFYHRMDPPAADTNATAVVETSDPTGVNLWYEFDDLGRLWARWSGGTTPTHGNTRSWQYDVLGRVASLMDENDNITEYLWDSISGRLQDENRYRDTGGTIVNTHYEYDSTAYHNPLSVADGNHHATTMTYSGELLRSRTTPPTAAAPNGAKTTYAYTCDGGTAPAVVNDPAAPAGSTQPCGLLASVTDPDGHVTRYGYDRYGDRTMEQTPAGGVVNSYYNPLGTVKYRTVSATVGGTGYTTSYAYDTHGRVTAEQGDYVYNPILGLNDQSAVTRTYDEDGNLASVKSDDVLVAEGDPDDARVQTYTYDAQDRLTGTVQEGHQLSRRLYDGAGHVADAWDANGVQTHYTYDSRGQLSAVGMPAYSDTPGVSGAATRNVRLSAYDYDNAGRLSDYWDAKGHVVSYTYTHDDLPLTQTYIAHVDPDTPATSRDVLLHSYGYDLAGNLTSDTQGSGSAARTTTYGYDAANENTKVTVDPAGLKRATTYSYDPAGLLTGTSTTDGTRTESAANVYDTTTGALLKSGVHLATGKDLVTQYTRDAFGRVLTVTDPRGVASLTSTAAPDPAYTTTFTYDAMGRLATKTDPPVMTESGTGAAAVKSSPVTTYAYNAFDENTQIRNPAGATTTMAYNTRGGLASRSKPDGDSGNWTYDWAGNVLTETVRSGRTVFTYDSRNRVHTATPYDRNTNLSYGGFTYAWDDNSNLLSSVTPTGAQTLHTYDDMDRAQTLDEVVRNGTATPDQDITQYRYDDFGELLRSWQTISGTTFEAKYGYDAAGELASQSETGRDTTNYKYDLAGRLIRTTDPLGRYTETEYDLAGRPSAVVNHDKDGTELARTDYTVDAAGNATAVTDPNRNVWQAAYDAENRLTSLTDPAPTAADGTKAAAPVTTVGYDVLGDATRVTDADAHTTYETYGTNGLPLTRVEPATTGQTSTADRTTSYTYDDFKRPKTVTEPGGVTTTYTYDGFSRVTAEAANGAEGGTASRTFSYDADGRTITVGAPGADETYSYDDRNLLVSANGPQGSSSYRYDSLGRLSVQQDPGATVTYGYTGLEDVGSLSDSVTGDTVSYHRDAAGQVKQITGTAAGEGSYPTRNLTYDALGRLTSETVVPAEPFQDQQSSLAYTWDKNGNLLTTTRSGHLTAAGTTTNTYDEDNRLTRSATLASATGSTPTGTDYTWDAVGNRKAGTSWTGTADTTTGKTTASYDERNRVTSTSGPGDTSTHYTWTARDTLSRTSTTTAGTTTDTASVFDSFDRLVGDGQHTYSYDSLDRLLTAATGTTAQHLTYGGTEAEPSSDGTWTYARSQDGTPLSAKKGTDSAQRLMEDSHGDVVAGLGLDFGDVSSSRAYDAFGNVTAQTSGSQPSVGYQGSWTDTTGRVSAEARWYDPTTGTFASHDPEATHLTSATSANAYLYGNANPTSLSDPTGRFSLGTLLNPLKAVTGSDVVEAAEAITRAAAGAVVDVAPEVVEGVVVVAGIPEEVVIIAGVAVVVGGTYLLGQAAASGTTSLGDYSDDPYVVSPADDTKPDDTPTKQPPHPTKPIVTGTKTTTSTTSWQTTTKWFDDTYLYTRTDSYSYTTTRQWTYYDNGTTAYNWWNGPTKHTWKIDAQPLIDLDHTVKVDTDAAAKPTAPRINGSAPAGGQCGSGGTPGSCLPRGGADLPDGATGHQTASDGSGAGDGDGTDQGMCMPEPDDEGDWVDPNQINFSQRTVSPNNHAEAMRSGDWDWSRPGTALKVIERNGQLVSYDNRRLDAAREVRAEDPSYRVRVERLDPSAANPAKTSGASWEESFEIRMKDPRNRDEEGCRVPYEGLPDRPQHVSNKKKR